MKKINLISSLIIIFSLTLLAVTLDFSKFLPVGVQQESKTSSAQRITAFCQDKADWRKCYGEQLGALNKNQTLPDTLKTLALVENLDKKTMDCHLISHRIASSEVEKNPQDWVSIFKYVNQEMCLGGFIHGAIEGKKRFESSFEVNEDSIPKICEAINIATREKQYDACSHVLGHILLAEIGGDLKKGTEICNKLPGELKTPCNNGVFMENITRDNLVDHGLAKHIQFDGDSVNMVEKTCRQFSGIAGTACWREISHLYAGLVNNNLERMWKFCSHAKNTNDRDECYIHSFNSLLPIPDFDESQLATICSPLEFDSIKFDRCYSWAIYNFMNNSIIVNNRAIVLCNLAVEDYKKKCFAMLGQRLAKVYSLSDSQNFCKEVPAQYKTSCTCPSCTRSLK